MSKEEIIAFIKKSLMESNLASRLSAEDEARDEIDFEDSLGTGSEDYYDDDINLGLEPLPTQGNSLTQGGDESYDDEFSDLNGYQEFGSDYKVNPQDLPSVFSGEQLAEMIREGVKRIHRQTTIENRIQQINEELDSLSEKKYSDSASNFIGKEISHLMKDKGYSHERAVAASINIARDKGYKVPSNESEAPSAIEKIKATLKGVSEKQREYNKENNLPLDWKGTKEGYHEFITNKKRHSGSN